MTKLRVSFMISLFSLRILPKAEMKQNLKNKKKAFMLASTSKSTYH